MTVSVTGKEKLVAFQKLHVKKLVKTAFSFLLFLFFSMTVFAQNIVKGRVTDDKGVSIQGVSVVVKNTSRGVTTDGTGHFSIQASSSDILVFSFVGYTDQEIIFGKKADLSVQLLTTD